MIVLLVIPTILIGIISYYLWVWTYWKRRGIPGPIGYPVVGSYFDILDHYYPPHRKIQEWTQKYGGIYGITEGLQKTLIISDPVLVHEVFVKQFDKFYGRNLNPLQGNPEKDTNVHMFLAQGFRWKRLRMISAPTFSNNNLRKIKDTVEDCALELVGHIDRQTGKDVDILQYYQEYTFDVISRIAMGQYESRIFNNPMLHAAKSIFDGKLDSTFMLCGILPYYADFIKYMAKYNKTPNPSGKMLIELKKQITERMKHREEDEKNGIEQGEPADFIDLFLDARADVDMLEEEHNEEFTKQNIKVNRQLTVDEIVAQCFLFLLAGFDTTAVSLSFTSFLLATNPEKIKKLQKEIDRECPDQIISTDQLSKLKYLDCVIKEALRMYPLGYRAVSRKCMKTTHIGEYLVERGVGIQVDTWTLHYDKKIWGEDAGEFRPERWDNMDDNSMKSSSYLPFGMGPRQCIGMRLAYMEEKLLLSHILRKYTFETTKDTFDKFILVGKATVSPEHVMLKCVPR